MELLSLTVSLVDLHRDVVYVKDAKGYVDREVPLSERARELFRKLVDEATTHGREHLFANPRTGRPLKSIKTAWKNACKAAGVRDLRIHDLRHTFGTRAADAGAPLPAIQRVMGHKSIKTTQRYTHATDEGMRRVVEIVGHKVEKPVTIRSQKAVGE